MLNALSLNRFLFVRMNFLKGAISFTQNLLWQEINFSRARPRPPQPSDPAPASPVLVPRPVSEIVARRRHCQLPAVPVTWTGRGPQSGRRRWRSTVAAEQTVHVAWSARCCEEQSPTAFGFSRALGPWSRLPEATVVVAWSRGSGRWQRLDTKVVLQRAIITGPEAASKSKVCHFYVLHLTSSIVS